MCRFQFVFHIFLRYVNHCIGKWHLGHYKREYTPTYRGFDSHVGYWTGHQDYFDHTAFEDSLWGLDMRRGMDVAYDLHGQYTTNVIAKESVRVIREHNVSKPLFLYMAHAAVHSGNPYSPLPAPDDTVANFTRINNFNRRKFAGNSLLPTLILSLITILIEINKYLQEC